MNGQFRIPCLKYLYAFRIVICTLLTAGCLSRAREDPEFDPSHFSHIIIDECASTNETTTLIPIAGIFPSTLHFTCIQSVSRHELIRINLFELGICSTRDEIKSKIVLAGDPKQLDAICKSTIAADLGYKVSYMERLFNRKLYQRDSKTQKYNPKYITQLVQNYRSHEAILHTPNVLFYENALKAKAPEGLFKNDVN